MKTKLGVIVSDLENLKELQAIKMPVKISYRLKRLVYKLQPILKSYDEKRNELVKEFGEEDEEKKIWNVKKESLPEFYAKLQELLDTDEEIDFEKIKIGELGGIEIAPKLLIDFIFEE